MKKSNQLINETSPYLLQHAHNPVDWHAWNDETLQKAKEQGKMLLISIGYSACHWCHVMERETFENSDLAALMNEHFICIKVDREERPDVDAVYMNAVQLIHGNGGWPLNCFALPDGRPFYGGTYFKPAQWEALLKNVAALFKNQRNELESQAQQILEGINQDSLIDDSPPDTSNHGELPDEAYQRWQQNFDFENGGSKGAPKFPMPSNLAFLLQYSYFAKDEKLKNYLRLSLDKMAMGGIYDQIGGGFARYSVDASWKVPHFEKMLYDNAQLISLYTLAFQILQNKEYLRIACETADFVLRELTSEEGLFFSALDADSEDEEGKYYVWIKAEFESVLGNDSELFADYFGVDKEALWEDGKNILTIQHYPKAFAKAKNIDSDLFIKNLAQAKLKLMQARHNRTRPGLDDKSLSSWNALMIKALVQLAAFSGEDKYLDAATKAMNTLIDKSYQEDGSLRHSYKNSRASVTAFLEDYALVADAAIEIYQLTMDEQWLDLANKLSAYAINNFYDENESMFWFTNSKTELLIARKKELYDNVIPSSNSVMAKVLFNLSRLFENARYADITNRMAGKMASWVKKHPGSFSNWASLLLYLNEPYFEIAVNGPSARTYIKRLYKAAYPGKVLAGAKSISSFPIFEKRFVPGKTMIYVCVNNTCQKPVEDPEEALEMIR